ncbi:hypothetical protein SAMN06297144_1660 [Sphingomonas guangdongensis]|uniref:UrcA family protein n=1 Tax=Sphingomonas guangdongensis TaxID=1141890 RepID=A0A285QYC6_9SPHN|nr:hypothetical protein [Sphingomonas guangdongensis]SOB86554.1 hypothetical protein SAMN06297144_1660 [Sphingomonas guangdongensis]
MRLVMLAVVVAATPVQAQTTGALDMGQLTGTLSMDAVTQAEARRAKGGRPFGAPAINPATRARLQASCRQMRRRGDAGTGLADYRRFDAMCRRYGY